MAYGDNPGKRVPPKVKKKTKKSPPKKQQFTLPKTHKTDSATRSEKPKAGPPSPKRTGGTPSRPQPVTRKRDAPPKVKDDKSDADRAKALAYRKKNKDYRRLLNKGELNIDVRKIKPKTAGPNIKIDAGPVSSKHLALKALEYAGRPGNAIASAADEEVKHIKKHGFNPLDIKPNKANIKAAKEGITGKRHTNFSKVLKTAGWNPKSTLGKIAKETVGFGLDIGTDPTTYVTLGAGKVAVKAGENASRKVIREGGSTAAAKAAREKAEKETKEKGRGIQVGIRMPGGREIRTSGKATAKLGKPLGKVAEKTNARKHAGRVLKHIAPDFREASEDAASHQARRRAGTQLRANTTRGQSVAAHTRESIEREVKDPKERVNLTAAVERAPEHVPKIKRVVEDTDAYKARKNRRKARKKHEQAQRRYEEAGRASTKRLREERKFAKQHEKRLRKDLKHVRRDIQAYHRNGDSMADYSRLERMEKEFGDAAERHHALANQAKTAGKMQVAAAHRRMAHRAEEKLDAVEARLEAIEKRAVGGNHITKMFEHKVGALRTARLGREEVEKQLDLAKKNGHGNGKVTLKGAIERRDAGRKLTDAKRALDEAENDVSKYGPVVKKKQVALRVGDKNGERYVRELTEPQVRQLQSLKAELAPLRNRLKTAPTEAEIRALGTRAKPGIESREQLQREINRVEQHIRGLEYEYRNNLPKQQTPHTEVAKFLREDNARMAKEEVARGILPEGKLRPNYMEHEFPEVIDPPRGIRGKRRQINRGRGGSFSPALKRAYGKLSAREINSMHRDQNWMPLFEEDAAKIQGHRRLKHEQKVAKKEFANTISHTSPMPVTPENLAGLPKELGVYRRTDGDDFTELTQREINAIADGKKPGQDELVILNRKTVEKARQQFDRATKSPNAWQRFVGGWKSLATVYNPSYYVGNEIGNRIMAWQADTTMRAWSQSHHAVNLLGRRNKFEKTAEAATGKSYRDTLNAKDKALLDLIEEGEKHGALSGFHQNELRNLTGKQPGRARRFSERRENQARIASYISARKDKGLTPEEAVEWVNKHHIDYGDLTPFEQALRDSFIPFYTFSARNARLQASKLVQRPGKFATFEKARQGSIDLADEDPEFADTLKRYQQAGTPFVLRIGGQSLLMFPRTPIDQGLGLIPGSVTEAGQQIANRIGAPQKAIPEAFFDYNSFLRQKIEDATNDQSKTALVIAPSWATELAKIPILKKKLDIQTRADGQVMWRGKAEWFVNLTPQGKFVKDIAMPKEEENRFKQDRGLAALGFIGIKVSDWDPDTNYDSKLLDERRKLKVQMNRMEILQKRTDPKHDLFNSKTYQKKKDRVEEIESELDERARKRGDKKAQAPRISDRPKSYEQELNDKIKKQQDKYQNYDKYLREKYERKSQEYDIRNGG